MAHFPRTRPFGTWVTGSDLLASELEDLDAKLSKAINGDEGGVWIPSTVIEIGGLGIKITGMATFTGGFSADDGLFASHLNVGGILSSAGDTYVGEILHVGTDAEVNGQVSCDSLFCGNGATLGAIQTPSGGDIDCGGDLDVDGSLSVDGPSQLAATQVASLNCVGAATVSGALSVGGASSLAGGGLTMGALSGTLSRPITTSEAGRVRKRVLTMGNVETTASAAIADIVFVRNGTLSADRILVLTKTGADEGDVMLIVNNDINFYVNVKEDTSSGYQFTTLKNGNFRTAWMLFTNGSWTTMLVV